MKPVYKIIGALVLLCSAAAGCVKIDRDYDFSKLNDGDIVVGDVFRAPLASKISFTIEDMFADLNEYVRRLGFDPSQIGEVPIPLDITSELRYDMGEPIGESVFDVLDSGGTLSLIVNGGNNMPVGYGITLRFVDNRGVYGEPGNVRFALDTIEIEPSADGQPSKVEEKIEITPEQLELICFSDGIWIEIHSSVSTVVFNRDDSLAISLQLEKIGGIRIDGDILRTE